MDTMVKATTVASHATNTALTCMKINHRPLYQSAIIKTAASSCHLNKHILDHLGAHLLYFPVLSLILTKQQIKIPTVKQHTCHTDH